MSREDLLAGLLPNDSCMVSYPTNVSEYVGQLITHVLLTYDMRVAHDEELNKRA